MDTMTDPPRDGPAPDLSSSGPRPGPVHGPQDTAGPAEDWAEAIALEAVTADGDTGPAVDREGQAERAVPLDAQPILEHCDERRLSIRERLRLFERACMMVHGDHQHGRIHGDLGPATVLMTADGVPFLGGTSEADSPARCVGPAPIDESAEHASPEQARGEAATTSSDVYSLGVVLYWLLTGQSPYFLLDRTPSEKARAVREQTPLSPSNIVRSPVEARGLAAARGTTPVRLRRMLAGDLDAIVSTALQKEPESRYPSAEHLADDVRRHLSGEPARARRGSARDRAAKFARRHVRGMIAALIVLASLAAAAGFGTWGTVHERRARNRAERSARDARAALDQLVDRIDAEELLNQPGADAARAALLEDARRYYEALLERKGAGAAPPLDRAEAISRIASMINRAGPADEAVARFQSAVAAWSDLASDRPDDTARQEGLARALGGLGRALAARNPEAGKDRRAEALRALVPARDRLEALADAGKLSAPGRRALLDVLEPIASIQFDEGLDDRSLASMERWRTTAKRAAFDRPEAIGPRASLARAENLRGLALSRRPEGTKEALGPFQKAAELQEAIVAGRPELPDAARQWAIYLENRGRCEQALGKLDSALQSVQKAVDVLEHLNRQRPDIVRYRSMLGSAYNQSSALRRARREPTEALADAEKARDVFEKLTADFPGDASARDQLARALHNVGRGLQASADPAGALRALQRASDIYESQGDSGTNNRYRLAANLASCLPLIGAKPGETAALDVEALGKADRLRRELYGRRAVEALREAVRDGLATPDVIASDPDLDPIRRRDDFRKLVRELKQDDGQSATDRPSSND